MQCRYARCILRAPRSPASPPQNCFHSNILSSLVRQIIVNFARWVYLMSVWETCRWAAATPCAQWISNLRVRHDSPGKTCTVLVPRGRAYSRSQNFQNCGTAPLSVYHVSWLAPEDILNLLPIHEPTHYTHSLAVVLRSSHHSSHI